MNAKLTLIVLGVIIGGAVGWLTAPAPAVDLKVGGVSVQVGGDKSGGSMAATDSSGGGVQISVGNGGFLADRNQRTIVFAVIGGIAGLAIGFVAGRSRAA
jgi:hypothetical protein